MQAMAMEENHHKEFWSCFQHGVDVVVASRDADQLLGVRDGFRRYVQGLGREMTVSVRAAAAAKEEVALWTTAEDTLTAANRQVTEMKREVDDPNAFRIALEEGLATLEVGGRNRDFLFSWAVVACSVGAACGGSGPVQIPERFMSGLDTRGSIRTPGTRRRGGILGSLTGGLESRREAFALATLHALSTLFFGLVELQTLPRGWND